MINKSCVRRLVSGSVVFFILTGIIPVSLVRSQENMALPIPGGRVLLSQNFDPPLLKGIRVYRNDPFRFDFILDKGDVHQPLLNELAPDTKATHGADRMPSGPDIKRLIKYFLASLTVPEKDLWVNLSPYEKDRIVPEAFGQTEMGRDLLAQDYILKQITASVIYPDDKVGKEFWDKIYAEALKRYGTTDIPVDTFNKVWITPVKATVYEHQDAAYVVESRLKVMLETDYIATGARKDEALPRLNIATSDHASSDIAKQVLRDLIIPILEKEVNEGQNFATLRQVYNSFILATWYKRKVKASIMGQAYVDQKKVSGIDIADKNEKEKIWSQYVEAFKKGAFDFIKEEKDPGTQEMLPRKYFSGGIKMGMDVFKVTDSAALPGVNGHEICVIEVVGEPQLKRPVKSGRVWETTDLLHHDPRKFIYSVKVGGLGRILKPSKADQPASYSLSVISDDYMHTFLNDSLNIGLVLDFNDEDVMAVLARMTGIAAFNKTIESQQVFMKQQIDRSLVRGDGNVMYQSLLTPSAQPSLDISPRQLIEASKHFKNKERFLNNEIIVRNSSSLQPIAIILMVRSQRFLDFSDTLYCLREWEQYKEIRNVMEAGGLPVIIVGEKNAPLEDARKIFLTEFSNFNETRPYVFEKKDSAAQHGTGGVDLNPSRMAMVVNQGGAPFEFDLDPAVMARLRDASGISPVIIGIRPVESLAIFMGTPKSTLK
ncbi:MAG: hypothetical protein WCI27_08645 [Candidatus Omnitrophota bacterium]